VPKAAAFVAKAVRGMPLQQPSIFFAASSVMSGSFFVARIRGNFEITG
jgi:hypothetical protein